MGFLQLLILLGAAGFLVCTASLVALHFLPTGYHPGPDAVSNYAVSRYGYLYQIQAFSSGICAACLLAWLIGFAPAPPIGGLIALGSYALSRMLIIFFPTDVEPPMTRTGVIHAVLAAITFTGIAVAVGMLTSTLASLPDWASVGWLLRAAAILTDASAIGFVFVSTVRPLRKILGLVERGIYLGTLVWLGIAFWGLLGLI